MTRWPAAVLLVISSGNAADNPKTVLDGVYSADQAARGQAAYAANCGSCHLDDLTAYRGALHGHAFAEAFQGGTLEHLFQITKKTMPRDAPASLRDDTYVDIIAYVLQTNSFPAGREELKLESLKGIQISAKTGQEAIPNFSLIAVTGCLGDGTGDTWTLTRATEPAKTANPDAMNAADLKSYETKALGKLSFKLLDTSYFQPGSHRGHKIVVKGFLIRHTEGDEINVTWLQMVASNCGT
jgi:mono/diheme cytochrome c family protein